MSPALVEIEAKARALEPEERALLAEALLASLREVHLAEIETAWEREIEHRVAAFDRGEGETYSAEEVFAEARRLST